MFHFKEPHRDILKEIVDIEQRLMNEIESMSDPIAVKVTQGNLNLLSILKKKYYDKMKENGS